MFTCPVCLNIYTNPKNLPCLYSLRLSTLSGVSTCSCSRKKTVYYVLRVANLRTRTCRVNFSCQQLEGLRRFMVYNEGNINCFKYHDLLTIFCETCDEIICSNCLISLVITETIIVLLTINLARQVIEI